MWQADRKQLLTVFYTRRKKHGAKLAGNKFKMNKYSAEFALGALLTTSCLICALFPKHMMVRGMVREKILSYNYL